MKTMKTWVAAAALLALTGTAQAALIDQGNGTVKDDTTNLIWLQDWDVNGLQNWSTQKAWAEGLDFAGSTDWRLPSIDEYVALFGEYANLTLVSQFTNVQSDGYWSGTEYAPDPGSAWFLDASVGGQGFAGEGNALYAVAVRPGDVTAAQAVPEPGTLALLLAAVGVGAVVRRRRAH